MSACQSADEQTVPGGPRPGTVQVRILARVAGRVLVAGKHTHKATPSLQNATGALGGCPPTRVPGGTGVALAAQSFPWPFWDPRPLLRRPLTQQHPHPADGVFALGGRARLVALDLARSAAIGLMVLAHVSDQLLAPEQWRTPAGVAYGAIRGITGPLFFVVSGWSFAAATLPFWADFRHRGPALSRRLRRAGVLFAWGYALTLPWWAPGFPVSAPAEAWEAFFAFGVLQTAATALVGAHLLLALAPSPRAFAALSALAALALVAVAPSAQSLAPVLLEHPLRGAFWAGKVAGGFPIAPYAAFFLVGSALGACARAEGWTSSRAAVVAAVGAGLGFASARLMAPVFARVLRPDEFWASSPSVFLHRLAAALLVLSAAFALSRVVRRAPGWLAFGSRRALTFYVGHMLLLWGTPLTPGLVHLVRPKLELWQSALVAAGCLVAIWLAARAWTVTPRWLDAATRVTRRSLSDEN